MEDNLMIVFWELLVGNEIVSNLVYERNWLMSTEMNHTRRDKVELICTFIFFVLFRSYKPLYSASVYYIYHYWPSKKR